MLVILRSRRRVRCRCTQNSSTRRNIRNMTWRNRRVAPSLHRRLNRPATLRMQPCLLLINNRRILSSECSHIRMIVLQNMTNRRLTRNIRLPSRQQRSRPTSTHSSNSSRRRYSSNYCRASLRARLVLRRLRCKV